MHRITVEHGAGIDVVVGAGELDAFVLPELVAAFDDTRGASRLVVDLTRVSFLDSTALGAVVRAARELGSAGGELRIVLPRGPARRIFEITGLDAALPVSDDRAAALRELS